MKTAKILGLLLFCSVAGMGQNRGSIKTGTTIYMAGTFNNWTPTPMQPDNGVWKLDSVLLTAGNQEMKFANTGNWSGQDWGDATGLFGVAKLSAGGGPNIKFTIVSEGFYMIRFNDITLEYSIQKNDGLAFITLEVTGDVNYCYGRDKVLAEIQTLTDYGSTGNITVTVPYGIVFWSLYFSGKLADGSTILPLFANITSATTKLTITAAGGAQRVYNLSFKISAALGGKEFLSFGFLKGKNPAAGLEADIWGTIDHASNSIEVKVPYKTEVSALAASFTSSKYACVYLPAPSNRLQWSGVTQNDFTNLKTFVIIAQDGGQAFWNVYTTRFPADTSNWLNNLTISGQKDCLGNEINSYLTFDPDKKVYSVRMRNGRDDTAELNINYAFPYLATSDHASAFTIPAKFNRDVEIRITSESGAIATYTIHPNWVASDNNKQITYFAFEPLSGDKGNPTLHKALIGEINENTKVIDVPVPYGTNVTALKASFVLSSGAILSRTADSHILVQTSGLTAIDYSWPLAFQVWSESCQTADYFVSLRYVPNSDFFLAGTFNNWMLTPMHMDGGLWKLDSVVMITGNQEMKFANTNNWSGNDWGDAAGMTGTAKIASGGGPNISFIISEGGFFTVSFKEQTFQYAVSKSDIKKINNDMYIAGTFSNWERLPLSFNGERWVSENLKLSAGAHEIKFANTSDWSGNAWGDTSGLFGIAKLATGSAPNIKFKIISTGEYKFGFNDITLEYYIQECSTSSQISLTFSGKGAGSQIGSITATNLRTNQRIVLPGNQTLLLSVSTGIPMTNLETGIGKVFPNPFSGITRFSADFQKPQTVDLRVLNVLGQQVAQSQTHVQPGQNEFALSVARTGIYFVSLTTEEGTSGYKVICTEAAKAGNWIQYMGARPNSQNNQSNPASTNLKNSTTGYSLGYRIGDVILYRCMSGNNITIITDSPISSKNYEVEFHDCADPSGKNYSIIKIGDQTWMAENLAYLPAVSPSATGSETAIHYYVYGYEGSTVATAKATANYSTYGVLYNWPAALTACPTGWHLPSDGEWTMLTNYLTNNGYGYGGSGSDIGKSLAANSGWTSSSIAGSVGNDQPGNNRSGFSALPGGFRSHVAGFFSLGNYAYFRSSTDDGSSYVWNRDLYYDVAFLSRGNGYRRAGLSVRCLKDASNTNTAPSAAFTITPTQGNTDTNFQFDASTSTDAETALSDLEVRWDWTGDGIWDTDYSKTKTASHQYSAAGMYPVKMEVKDGGGLTDTETETVTVTTISTLPTVTTTSPITEITQTTATGGGNVTSAGSASVTARGVCWSTSQNPTIANSKTSDGAGTGVFSSNLTGLTAGTNYFVRAYATNSAGTAYGQEVPFTTSEASTGTFTDSRDSKTYSWVKIGTQKWMSQNLAYLPAVSPPATGSETAANYYVYGYYGSSVSAAKATANYFTYGVLYNWPAAMASCPSGWHLPSDAEWNTLNDYLGSSAGGKMKETGTAHWISPNTGATNSSGFTALPGGVRYIDGDYHHLGNYTTMWSSTENGTSTAWYRHLGYDIDVLNRNSDVYSCGVTVRCVQGVVLPMVTTSAITDITTTIASGGGNVLSDGGATVTARGVCWSTSQNPTIADGKTSDGTGIGTFTSNLTGLTTGTTYYVRAYATNSAGTAYGDEVNFTAGRFTDSRDGRAYKFVQIGTQTWMAENLAYLPAVSPSATGSDSEPNYYVYGYQGTSVSEAKATSNYSTYGVLFNWPAAMTACPSGWHLPTDAEWTTLTDYLTNNGYGYGGSGSDIGKAMASTSGWTTYSTAGTVGNDQASNNSSGFTALPAGYLYYGGGFDNLGYNALLWSSSEDGSSNAWYRYLTYDYDGAYRYDDYRRCGFSVRCLKNN